VAELLAGGPSLVVLDGDPVVSLPVAAALSRRAHPVLFLPRWLYGEAVLPAQPLLGQLLDLPALLETGARPSAVMVLDGGRLDGVPSRSWRDPRVDNRGEIAGDDLPNTAALLAAGVRRVVDLRPPGQPVPETFERFAYAPFVLAGIDVERRTWP
jgi:hypothetical protein